MAEAIVTPRVGVTVAQGAELDVGLPFAHPQGKRAEGKILGASGEGKDVLAPDRERRSMTGEEEPPALEPHRAAIGAGKFAVADDTNLDEAHVRVFGVL